LVLDEQGNYLSCFTAFCERQQIIVSPWVIGDLEIVDCRLYPCPEVSVQDEGCDPVVRVHMLEEFGQIVALSHPAYLTNCSKFVVEIAGLPRDAGLECSYSCNTIACES